MDIALGKALNSVPMKELMKVESYNRRLVVGQLRNYLAYHMRKGDASSDEVMEAAAKRVEPLSENEVIQEAARAYEEAPELFWGFLEYVKASLIHFRDLQELARIHPYVKEAMDICKANYGKMLELLTRYLAELLCQRDPRMDKEAATRILTEKAADSDVFRAENFLLLHGFWKKNPESFIEGLRAEAVAMGYIEPPAAAKKEGVSKPPKRLSGGYLN